MHVHRDKNGKIDRMTRAYCSGDGTTEFLPNDHADIEAFRKRPELAPLPDIRKAVAEATDFQDFQRRLVGGG